MVRGQVRAEPCAAQLARCGASMHACFAADEGSLLQFPWFTWSCGLWRRGRGSGGAGAASPESTAFELLFSIRSPGQREVGRPNLPLSHFRHRAASPVQSWDQLMHPWNPSALQCLSWVANLLKICSGRALVCEDNIPKSGFGMRG